jgi:hypothetical protein
MIAIRFVANHRGVTDMPFLLWVVYPYSIWMGCCSVLLGQHKREE